MVADLPPSYHASEDIHEQSDIDEMSLEADVGYIANPDLIVPRDIKILKSIPPRMPPVLGVSRLTRTFSSNAEVLGPTSIGQHADTQRGIPPSPASA